ncbi:uncharacterized protein BDW70DRAFT_162898 [Aspergillus foveolatus]|uniref:uncharacterized protein n=1 Tax=Aspergillus foveolatus TaxID=210207 RepID=UPI003CCE139C
MPRLRRSPCLQCRYRKVRCDRRQNTCGSCERLQFDCSFRETAGRDRGEKKDRQLAPPERRRASRACVGCRRLKARCSGERPECNNCRQRQRRCHYIDTEAPAEKLLGPLDELKGSRLVFPISQQETADAIDRFFRHLYPVPAFAFLHEPSIRRQFQEATLDQILALALLAVVNVFFCSESAILQACRSWVQQVEDELWEHLHEPSVRRVQCLLLAVHYHVQSGSFSRAYMLAGIAARSATALRLNYERPELEPVAQETRRRVLWALTSIDGHFSVGLPEYEAMPYAIVYKQLPGPEEEFTGLQPESPSHPNLLAACIQISKIQRDVMRLTRQLAISDKPLLELPALVQEIQNDLWRLHADLELRHDFSISSTTQPLKMKDSLWFVRYLLASLSWHQVHCDLYRIFLPGYAEAVPTVIMDATDAAFRQHAAEMCRIHVQRILKILRGLFDLDVPLLPSYVAVCAYQSARLTLFLPSLSRTDDRLTEKSVADEGSMVLQLLCKFFQASPWAQDIIADLQRLLRTGASPALWVGTGRERHGQLAVHSLIRQAKFVDRGNDS